MAGQMAVLGELDYPDLGVDDEEIEGRAAHFDTAEEAMGALKYVAEELAGSMATLATLAENRMAAQEAGYSRMDGGGDSVAMDPGADAVSKLPVADLKQLRDGLKNAVWTIASSQGGDAADHPEVQTARRALFELVSRVKYDVAKALNVSGITEEDVMNLGEQADTEELQAAVDEAEERAGEAAGRVSEMQAQLDEAEGAKMALKEEVERRRYFSDKPIP